MGPFIIIVRPRALADKIDAAGQAFEKIAIPTRANPHCHEFRVFQDPDDTQSFALVERWVSLYAVMAHSRRDYMAEYLSTKDVIFEAPPYSDFQREIFLTSAA